MATTNELLEQIALLEKQIVTEQNKLPGLITSEAEWRRQSQEPCNFSLKAKQQRCVDDKAYKKQRADSLLTQINSTKQTIARLTAQKEQLAETLDAMNEASVNLSQQGINLEADTIERQIAAETTSQETLLNATAQADADKKMKLIIGIAVAVVLVALISFLLYRKFKN